MAWGQLQLDPSKDYVAEALSRGAERVAGGIAQGIDNFNKGQDRQVDLTVAKAKAAQEASQFNTTTTVHVMDMQERAKDRAFQLYQGKKSEIQQNAILQGARPGANHNEIEDRLTADLADLEKEYEPLLNPDQFSRTQGITLPVQEPKETLNTPAATSNTQGVIPSVQEPKEASDRIAHALNTPAATPNTPVATPEISGASSSTISPAQTATEQPKLVEQAPSTPLHAPSLKEPLKTWSQISADSKTRAEVNKHMDLVRGAGVFTESEITEYATKRGYDLATEVGAKAMWADTKKLAAEKPTPDMKPDMLESADAKGPYKQMGFWITNKKTKGGMPTFRAVGQKVYSAGALKLEHSMSRPVPGMVGTFYDSGKGVFFKNIQDPTDPEKQVRQYLTSDEVTKGNLVQRLKYSDIAFKGSPATRRQFAAIKSLTESHVGFDGAPREALLDQAVTERNKLPDTGFKSLNQLAQIPLGQVSNNLAGFTTLNTEIADQVATVLAGGGTTIATSKVQQALHMLQEAYTRGQYTTAIKMVREALESRIRALEKEMNYSDNPTSGTIKPVKKWVIEEDK